MRVGEDRCSDVNNGMRVVVQRIGFIAFATLQTFTVRSWKPSPVGATLAGPHGSGLLESIRTMVTQPEMPEAEEFVRIMSLHKSQGLTMRTNSSVSDISGCVTIVLRDPNKPLP